MNSKGNNVLQSFFDLLFEELGIESINIFEKQDEVNKIIQEWINNGHPRFSEDLYEVIKDKFIEQNKKYFNKYILEQEFSMLWLNYSPKYTLKLPTPS